VSDDQPFFSDVLIDGFYSPAYILRSVREFLTGYPSALIGTLQARAAYLNNDTATLQELIDFTDDMKKVCLEACFLYAFLEHRQLDEVSLEEHGIDLGDIGRRSEDGRSRKLQFDGLECRDDVVQEDINDAATKYGVSKASLQYTLGMSCLPFGVTFVTKLIKDNGGDVTCADNSYNPPCCLEGATFPENGIYDPDELRGVGCLKEVPGYLVPRVTANEGELEEVGGGYKYETFQGCDKGVPDWEKNSYTMFRSQRLGTGWYTPDNYTFPDMEFNSPTYARDLGLGDISATFQPVIGGSVGNQYAPRGITTGLFEYQLTDGVPLNESISIFSRNMRSEIGFLYDKTTEVKGIDTAEFLPNVTHLLLKHENNQRRGVAVPYQGAICNTYNFGIPIFTSKSYYMGGSNEFLNQSDNSNHDASESGAIEIYVNWGGSYQLLTPTLRDEMEATGNFVINMVIEPASGKAIGGSRKVLLSTSNWECDPTTDEVCKLFLEVDDTNQCYASQYTAETALAQSLNLTNSWLTSACSNLNAFTPYVHGGKVNPIFWVDEEIVLTDDQAAMFISIMDTRYATHVLLVISPLLGTIALAILTSFYWQNLNLTPKEKELGADWGDQELRTFNNILGPDTEGLNVSSDGVPQLTNHVDSGGGSHDPEDGKIEEEEEEELQGVGLIEPRKRVVSL